MASKQILDVLKQLRLPEPNSHKGQNGKVLLIGGSELFHAASKWSLDVVSRLSDMVFYASVPSNNELIQQAKKEFWNGIVINREAIFDYIEEADCILIGPGMERDELKIRSTEPEIKDQLTPETWNTNTKAVVDTLLHRYPNKKWVIDAGALQMVAPSLLNQNCVLTPHPKELQALMQKLGGVELPTDLQVVTAQLQGATIILKGKEDMVVTTNRQLKVTGGNPGMTKGGTGDVLAGLVAGLYASNDAWTAAVVASYVNKKAGEALAKTVGPFFNASDLAAKIPEVLWAECG